MKKHNKVNESGVDLSEYKDTDTCPYCGGDQVYVDHPYMGQFYDGESYTSECTCPECDRRWNVNWTVKFEDVRERFDESGRFEDMDGGAEDAGWNDRLALSSKEAYNALGGRASVDKFTERLNKRMGQWANVSIDACIDEKNPEDMDFLNVQIEMKYAANKNLPDKFMEQKEEAVTEMVWEYLNRHGLDFDYEANGDGEFGPIASYRIRRATN